MIYARNIEPCERVSKIDSREQMRQREADRRVAKGEYVLMRMGRLGLGAPDACPNEIDDVLERLDR
jgi:hypothetical protein